MVPVPATAVIVAPAASLAVSPSTVNPSKVTEKLINNAPATSIKVAEEFLESVVVDKTPVQAEDIDVPKVAEAMGEKVAASEVTTSKVEVVAELAVDKVVEATIENVADLEATVSVATAPKGKEEAAGDDFEL
jgi:hypothetical protein